MCRLGGAGQATTDDDGHQNRTRHALDAEAKRREDGNPDTDRDRGVLPDRGERLRDVAVGGDEERVAQAGAPALGIEVGRAEERTARTRDESEHENAYNDGAKREATPSRAREREDENDHEREEKRRDKRPEAADELGAATPALPVGREPHDAREERKERDALLRRLEPRDQPSPDERQPGNQTGGVCGDRHGGIGVELIARRLRHDHRHSDVDGRERRDRPLRHGSHGRNPLTLGSQRRCGPKSVRGQSVSCRPYATPPSSRRSWRLC